MYFNHNHNTELYTKLLDIHLIYKNIFASNAAISCMNTDPYYNQYFNHLSHVHECLMT
jgi:hypothetical protein